MQYSFKLEYVNGNGNLSDINNPKNESAELKVSTRAGAKPATPADVKLVEKMVSSQLAGELLKMQHTINC